MTTDERIAQLTRKTYVIDEPELIVRKHASCLEVIIGQDVLVVPR